MNQASALGVLAGGLLGCGLLLVWIRLPMRRRPTLQDRLAPYLRDTPAPSRLLAPAVTDDRGLLGRLLTPLVTRLAQTIESTLGGAASIARRQARSGQEADVAAFRAEQVAWGAAGAAMGLAGGLAYWARGHPNPTLPLLLVGLGAIGGVVARDQALSAAVERREARMIAEFPTVAELLALSVGAGEGTAAALERVCRISSGELSRELRTCLDEARAGANLPTALQGLSARTGLPGLSRFVDGIVIALERGTPLADVLRAQAQDVREEGRRAVMEAAGRKEILMMVPVVFLVLPITVLFAIYPGLMYLRFTP